MRKLLSFLALLMMMVTSSFAAAPDGIGNITVKYYPEAPVKPVLDIIFEDQKDVAPSWSVDIKLDGKKINCEMGQDWNEIYAYPSEQLAVGKHTIVFPAGSLMLNSTATYDKECSATFVVADFTATASQLPTNDYSFVNAEFKLSEIAKAFGTDAATLASALNEGSATFGLFDADGQLIGNTADGPGSYWMKADGSVTSWGPDAVVYNGLINYNASADILVIPVGQYPDAFKGGEIWVNVFTLKYNGTSKTLGVMLKIIGENEGSAPVVAIEESEGVYTVTSTSADAALYTLCKPMSWLDEGETPESCLQAEIEGLGTMIDSEETWELYDHMGMQPAPKAFTVADYMEMYAGEEMFLIAANIGWNGEKLAVISNIEQVNFTVSAPESTLVNGDFAQGVVGDVNIATYAKDGEVNQMQPVPGWEFGVTNGDARAAGVVAYGSGTTLGGASYGVPAAGPEGTNGKALGMVGVWTGTVQYVQDVTLPAGKYTMTVPVYNTQGTQAFVKNLIGVKYGETENFAAATSYPVGEWTNEIINFELEEETKVTVSLGYQGANVGSAAAQHLFLDCVKLMAKNDPVIEVTLIADAETEYALNGHSTITIDKPVSAIKVTGLDQTMGEVTYAIYGMDQSTLASGTLSVNTIGYAEFAPVGMYEGNQYNVVIATAEETLFEQNVIGAAEPPVYEIFATIIDGEEAIALNAHSAVSVEKAKAIEVSFDGFVPRQAGYSVNTLKLVAGEESSSWEIDETIAQGALTLSGKGYVEFEEIIPFEAGTRYCVIINADNESATFEINGAYAYPIYGQLELGAFDGNSYYATFSSSRPAFVEFKANVLTVKVDGTKLKLDTSTFFGQDVTEEVEDGYTVKGTWIPANTGVLLKSYTNKVRVWTSANKEIDPINNVNFLRPAAEEMQKGYKFYMLAYGDEALTPHTLGFYYGAEDGAPFEARQGSAYLAVPKNVEAKGFCFADDATAIKNVDAEDGANAVYNLQGQRVSGSQKGIVIVNGKKVIK